MFFSLFYGLFVYLTFHMTSVKEELTDELLKNWIKNWTTLLDNREQELDRREQRLKEQEKQLEKRQYKHKETRRCAHTSLPCWFNGDEKTYRKFLKNKVKKIKKQLANSKKWLGKVAFLFKLLSCFVLFEVLGCRRGANFIQVFFYIILFYF